MSWFERLAGGLAGLLLVCQAEPALAHAPIEGIGAFYNGVLHPFLLPPHFLLLAGLGLMLGQNLPGRGCTSWLIFVGTYCAAVAVSSLVMTAIFEAVLLGFALGLGALVALNRPLAVRLVPLLMATGAIAVGLDSTPEAQSARAVWLGAAGTAVGGVAVVTLVGGLAAAVSRGWQRIGVRVAGAWTAAAASIVLTLSLAAPRAAS